MLKFMWSAYAGNLESVMGSLFVVAIIVTVMALLSGASTYLLSFRPTEEELEFKHAMRRLLDAVATINKPLALELESNSETPVAFLSQSELLMKTYRQTGSFDDLIEEPTDLTKVVILLELGA